MYLDTLCLFFNMFHSKSVFHSSDIVPMKLLSEGCLFFLWPGRSQVAKVILTVYFHSVTRSSMFFYFLFMLCLLSYHFEKQLKSLGFFSSVLFLVFSAFPCTCSPLFSSAKWFSLNAASQRWALDGEQTPFWESCRNRFILLCLESHGDTCYQSSP